MNDIIYALRLLRKSPVFTLTAILTLALAIGGNTAMFTVIRAVLLKPLQYRDPEHLVRISGGATPTRYRLFAAEAHSFSGIGAFTGAEDLSLTAGAATPEALKGARVSAGFLRILGAEPMLGRDFLPGEDVPGGTPAVMLSAELWRRRFAGDPRILGKTIGLAGTAYTVTGVLTPGFQFPSAGVDVWLPAPSEWPQMAASSRALSPFLTVFGRVKPGVPLAQATAELRVIQRQYAAAHPAMLDAKLRVPLQAIPWKDSLVGGVRSMLWMLFGAVGFVLLIACANVGSLLLAGAAAREREFAVRAALGATRGRLLRQFLAESLLLSSAGGLVGLLFAAWALRAIPHIAAFDVPRTAEIHLDWAVLAFAASVSFAAGLVFGLAPARGASRLDPIAVLRAGGAPPREAAAARAFLVAGQIAFSIVLLIGAALLMKSVANLRAVDLGFNPSQVLTMRISLPPARYGSDLKKTAFFTGLIHGVIAAPGVQSATAALSLPMTAFAGTPVQDAAKPPLKLNERPIATVLPVLPGYFETLRIPIRRGRDFTDRDTLGSPRAAIVDENLARLLWPAYPEGQDPVGQRLLVGGVNSQPAEIVGVAAHARQNLEDNAWPGTVYVSFAQNPPQIAMVAVRSNAGPSQAASAVREQARILGGDLSITAVGGMDALVDAETGQRRSILLLLGAFAGVAVLLALIGLYGVVTYSVERRLREIGIRRALGAQRGDILRMIVGRGIALSLAGVAAGIVGALALTRVMASLLFHVSATDPATFAVLALAFVLVAAAASYIPARRGIREDPMASLRL